MKESPVMLITGTRKGIGRYLAEYYCERHWRVVGCSRQPTDFVHDRYVHHQVDVADESQVRTLCNAIQCDYGQLDALVNNAAVNPALAPVLLASAASALQTLQTNILGTFLCCREGAKIMQKRKCGRIINLGSMAAHHTVAGEAMYTASKAAVHAFTRVLARELHPFGITCNVVAPAAIATDLSARVSPDALHDVLRRNAIPETGRMSDVSNTIDWLMRPQSGAMTGQVIWLGGV